MPSANDDQRPKEDQISHCHVYHNCWIMLLKSNVGYKLETVDQVFIANCQRHQTKGKFLLANNWLTCAIIDVMGAARHIHWLELSEPSGLCLALRSLIRHCVACVGASSAHIHRSANQWTWWKYTYIEITFVYLTFSVTAISLNPLIRNYLYEKLFFLKLFYSSMY